MGRMKDLLITMQEKDHERSLKEKRAKQNGKNKKRRRVKSYE